MSSLSSQTTCFGRQHSRPWEDKRWSSSHRSRRSRSSHCSRSSCHLCWTPPRGEGHARHGGCPSPSAPDDTLGCRGWGFPVGIRPSGPRGRDDAGTPRPSRLPVRGGQCRDTRGRGRGCPYHDRQLGLSIRGHVRFSCNYGLNLSICDIPTCWSS